jgi:hypothetical protein
VYASVCEGNGVFASEGGVVGGFEGECSSVLG